jgi:hypothetical protein
MKPIKPSEERELLQERRHIKWKNEIVKSQVILEIMEAKTARREIFSQSLPAIYVEEAGDQIPLLERAFFISHQLWWIRQLLLLSGILKYTKNFFCGYSAEREDVKMISCSHTIHF